MGKGAQRPVGIGRTPRKIDKNRSDRYIHGYVLGKFPSASMKAGHCMIGAEKTPWKWQQGTGCVCFVGMIPTGFGGDI